jgi:hypothetical protein
MRHVSSLREATMKRAAVVAASLAAIAASMVVPIGTAGAAEPPSPSPADPADGQVHPDRVLAPDQQLGAGWRRSSDRAVTTAGDETGLHVLVADRREAYRWRTAATLVEPAIESDQWIGQLCVTGSGSRAVVVYAPRDFTNNPLSMELGAFAAVVDLDTGAVTKLAERVTLGYYNPACGSGETAVLSRLEQSPAAGVPAKTWIGMVDATAARFEWQARADGQLTSAVPVGGRIVAARGYGLVAVDHDGQMTTVAHTAGTPLRLMPDGDRGLALQIARRYDADLARLVDGELRTVATVPLGAVKLRPGAGGDVYAVGARAPERMGGSVPPTWRVVDAPPDSEPSTTGGLVVTRVRSAREAAGQIVTGTGMPGSVQITATTLDSRADLRFTARTGAGAAGRGASPAQGAPAGGGAPDGVQPAQDGSTVPWDPDRACAVPRNDPAIQVYQPSPLQVEWAADLAVRGQLSFSRPADWLNNGLPAYSPQLLFPRLSLVGGGDVPAQIMLGILAQESNMWQASFHVVDALAGNPLTSSGFYGLEWNNPDPRQIDWSKVDCGYGVAQVTTGMHRDDTGEMVDGLVMTELRQEAVVLDYAANVAAGLRILQSKWNQLANAEILANDGDPQHIENWFLAAWAYNSGIQPDERFGNDTGCTPGPSCTDDHGNWGLGWSNNPASPLYPEDRQMFLTAPLGSVDILPPDEVGYDNARHPNHWSYPERIMGWAYTSLRRWDYAEQRWLDTYWTTGNDETFRQAQPERLTFCVASINQCDPDDPTPEPPGDFPDYPATLCQRDDLRCWWHAPVTWEPDCDTECGWENRRFTTVEPRPLAEAIYDSQCSTDGLPAGARLIDDVDSAGPLGPQGCSRTWPVGGSFSLRFESMTGPQGTPIYPGKPDFHQIGGGFGGHFWFTHTRREPDYDYMRMTGRWTVDPVNAWARVFVHVPDHGAHTQQARYKIHLPSGGEPKHRAITQHYQRHTWVDIGVFDFRGTGNPVIELSNVATDGFGVHDVAWDAIAVQPLPAKPDHFVVAMGDSYASGEGSFNYYSESYQYVEDGNQAGSFRNICRRSPDTWSRQIQLAGAPGSFGELKDGLHNDLDFHLLACAGARAHHMLGTEITFPGQPVEPNPLGNLPQGPQDGRELTEIDRGFLDENTTLVMLIVGGNDAGWTGVLDRCIAGDLDCHNDDDFRNDVIDLISGPVPAAVSQVMEQIAQVAPNATIFLVGYPQLFSEGPDCSSLLLSGAERGFLNNLAQVFAVNTVLDPTVFDPTASGRSFGVPVTDVDFGPVCHLLSDYQGQGINGVRFENPPFYWEGAGDGSFHPKTGGYERYGIVVQGALTARGYVW